MAFQLKKEVTSLLKQIKYFQSVVEENSFTKAANSHFISQLAISQQIRGLEAELGVTLLTRKNRGFELAEAGYYFYERSLALVADFDALCQETQVIANQRAVQLSVGYLYSYEGSEIQEVIAGFASQLLDVALTVKTETHDQLYNDLCFGKIDLIINDQRRAFSTDYENLVLTSLPLYIAFAAFNPHTKEEVLAVKNSLDKPLILIVDSQQEEAERAYYRDYIGFSGDMQFVPNVTEAKMSVTANRGYLPLEFGKGASLPPTLSCRPIYKQGKSILRRMYAFWKKDNSDYYVETMAELLTKAFQQN